MNEDRAMIKQIFLVAAIVVGASVNSQAQPDPTPTPVPPDLTTPTPALPAPSYPIVEPWVAPTGTDTVLGGAVIKPNKDTTIDARAWMDPNGNYSVGGTVTFPLPERK